jgi:hypothetical protein
MLPVPLREAIAIFLSEIGEDRSYFDPFYKKNGAAPLASLSPDLEKDEKSIPFLFTGNVSLDMRRGDGFLFPLQMFFFLYFLTFSSAFRVFYDQRRYQSR